MVAYQGTLLMHLSWCAPFCEAIFSEADLEEFTAIHTFCSYTSSCVYCCGTSCGYDQERLAVIMPGESLKVNNYLVRVCGLDRQRIKRRGVISQ